MVNFDTMDYVAPTLKSDKTVNYADPVEEISRVRKACSQARLQAFAAAAAR